MKKTLIIILTCLFVAGVVGCGVYLIIDLCTRDDCKTEVGCD